ncbi:hypothetical protein RDI86_01395 [Cellulosimicrobium sp. XJ-DQ-B-000]|uniref:hypothetical protein n=1 Tax=Cellulosimicrobium sp. XJ-DQ-B-000 TaxID=3072182 RepID=UPI0028089414|nr:hypothetical protein [Cellulosimicrobium sp. XJ-DQ-B-000]MDQ8040503.1 hypothetical protein [Cellulosimicrobium sp. XJ-DQ-B-000]
MGLLSQALGAWYGPSHARNELVIPGSGDVHVRVFSGVVTVTDVQEALEMAERVFRFEAATYAPPGSAVVVRGHSGTGGFREGVKVADLAGAEWHSARFEVGFATENGNPHDEWGRYQWHEAVRFDINGYESSLTASVKPTEVAAAAPDSTSLRAHQAALTTLLAGRRRRTPPVRRRQVWAAAAPALIVASWLWAMLATAPPFAFWLFAGVLALFACGSLYRLFGPKRPAGTLGPTPETNGRLMVDLTPRDKVLAERANRRADFKSKIVGAVVFSPIAAAAGAWILSVVGPR